MNRSNTPHSMPLQRHCSLVGHRFSGGQGATRPQELCHSASQPVSTGFQSWALAFSVHGRRCGRRARLSTTLTLLALLFLLPACGISTVPLTVQIRDASTHEPVADAAVEASSLALGASLAPSDVVDELFGRRASHSSKALTDAQGEARVEYIQGRAVRVTVWRVGGSPATVLLSPGGTADRTWTVAMQSPPNSGEIEVSVWQENVP